MNPGIGLRLYLSWAEINMGRSRWAEIGEYPFSARRDRSPTTFGESVSQISLRYFVGEPVSAKQWSPDGDTVSMQ